MRQALELRIALDLIERLLRVVLLAGMQLRNAENEARIRLVLKSTLGKSVRQGFGRLVVLLVAEVGKPKALRPSCPSWPFAASAAILGSEA